MMNINNQLGLATHPIPVYDTSVDQQLGFIGSDGQGMMFNADGGEYWASKASPNYSDDNLIMLNEDDNFLNATAGGFGGNAKVDRDTRVATASQMAELNKLKDGLKNKTIRTVGSLNATKFTDLNKYLVELQKLKAEEEKSIANFESQLALKENAVTEAGSKIRTSREYTRRRNINQLYWYSQNAIVVLDDAIKSVTEEIKLQKAKLDNDAYAKAKASNTIVAYTEYLKNYPEGLSVDKANKAIDDIKKAEKIKALENQKINATPEEKKQIDAEIDKILGVATGTTGTIATRIFLYGGVALVGVYILYKVFKGNSATA
jgi:hypothetical protein